MSFEIKNDETQKTCITHFRGGLKSKQGGGVVTKRGVMVSIKV